MRYIDSWLTGLGLEYVIPKLKANGITTPKKLAQLTLRDMYEVVGVEDAEDRKKLYFLIQRLHTILNKGDSPTSRSKSGEALEDGDTADTLSRSFSQEGAVSASPGKGGPSPSASPHKDQMQARKKPSVRAKAASTKGVSDELMKSTGTELSNGSEEDLRVLRRNRRNSLEAGPGSSSAAGEQRSRSTAGAGTGAGSGRGPVAVPSRSRTAATSTAGAAAEVEVEEHLAVSQSTAAATVGRRLASGSRVGSARQIDTTEASGAPVPASAPSRLSNRPAIATRSGSSRLASGRAAAPSASRPEDSNNDQSSVEFEYRNPQRVRSQRGVLQQPQQAAAAAPSPVKASRPGSRADAPGGNKPLPSPGSDGRPVVKSMRHVTASGVPSPPSPLAIRGGLSVEARKAQLRRLSNRADDFSDEEGGSPAVAREEPADPSDDVDYAAAYEYRESKKTVHETASMRKGSAAPAPVPATARSAGGRGGAGRQPQAPVRINSSRGRSQPPPPPPPPVPMQQASYNDGGYHDYDEEDIEGEGEEEDKYVEGYLEEYTEEYVEEEYDLQEDEQQQEEEYDDYEYADDVNGGAANGTDMQNEYANQQQQPPIEDMAIRVVLRKRPISRKEASNGDYDVLEITRGGVVDVHEPKIKVDLTKVVETQRFVFDDAFDDFETNEHIYERTMRHLVNFVFEGGKASCFAYGQTGSGKTFTMMGSRPDAPAEATVNAGLYVLAARDVFELLRYPEYQHLQVLVSCFEIYGGKLFDLLNDRSVVRCLEDAKQQVQLPGLSEHQVLDVQHLLELMACAHAQRSTGSTGANAESSRSHQVLQLVLREPSQVVRKFGRDVVVKAAGSANDGKARGGKLSFIDLAGSERGADTTHASKQTRMEGAEINTSLLALKEVIRSLERKHGHTPFRGSKLTQVLKDSFVGEKTRTCMVACVSPSHSNCEHTLNTLRYADRVKEHQSGGSGGGGGGGGHIGSSNYDSMAYDASQAQRPRTAQVAAPAPAPAPAPTGAAGQRSRQSLLTKPGDGRPRTASGAAVASVDSLNHNELGRGEKENLMMPPQQQHKRVGSVQNLRKYVPDMDPSSSSSRSQSVSTRPTGSIPPPPPQQQQQASKRRSSMSSAAPTGIAASAPVPPAAIVRSTSGRRQPLPSSPSRRPAPAPSSKVQQGQGQAHSQVDAQAAASRQLMNRRASAGASVSRQPPPPPQQQAQQMQAAGYGGGMGRGTASASAHRSRDAVEVDFSEVYQDPTLGSRSAEAAQARARTQARTQREQERAQGVQGGRGAVPVRGSSSRGRDRQLDLSLDNLEEDMGGGGAVASTAAGFVDRRGVASYEDVGSEAFDEEDEQQRFEDEDEGMTEDREDEAEEGSGEMGEFDSTELIQRTVSLLSAHKLAIAEMVEVMKDEMELVQEMENVDDRNSELYIDKLERILSIKSEAIGSLRDELNSFQEFRAICD